MNDFCFFTCYDHVYHDTAKGCVNSIKKFYPDAKIYEFIVPRKETGWDLQHFCWFHLIKGKELFDGYRRIISVDSDHVMCDRCPELFEDFDLAVVQNNIPVTDTYGGLSNKIYINAGLTVCTNKKVWDEWMDEYDKRCKKGWNELHEQNALNYIYHTSKAKIKLLEYMNKTYGISSIDGYEYMKLIDGELYVPTEDIYSHVVTDKKLKMIHFAGNVWKINGKIMWHKIKDEQARNYLISLTKEL
jgi:hypothetical protein